MSKAKRALPWGLTACLFLVILIPSCFFGGGRRPVPEETMESYYSMLDPTLPVDGQILELRERVKRDPLNPGFRLELARLWYEKGLLLAAESTLVELCRDVPDMHEAWNDLGRVYIGMQAYEEAKEALERAIRIAPDFAAAHYNLAIARASNNEVKGVLDEYVKALLLDPSLMDVDKNWHATQNPWISVFKHYQYMMERGQRLPKDTPTEAKASDETPEAAGPKE